MTLAEILRKQAERAPASPPLRPHPTPAVACARVTLEVERVARKVALARAAS